MAAGSRALGNGGDLTPGPASAFRPWWRPHLRQGDLVVYHVDLTPANGSESAALAWLDESENERRRRYLGDLPKRQFALCRAALRILLVQRLDCPNRSLRFEEGRRGKPFALIGDERCGFSFNVSHSGDHGMIAIAPGGRLGVDVEVRRERKAIDQLIEILLTEAERRQMEQMDSDRRISRFYDLWTAKEALVKANGLGHAIDVSRLNLVDSVGRSGETRCFHDRDVLGGRWEISNLGTAVFAASLARELPPAP